MSHGQQAVSGPHLICHGGITSFMSNRKWVTLITLQMCRGLNICQDVRIHLSSVTISFQVTVWKSGGEFIVHFFQAVGTHISALTESEQLNYILLVKPKELVTHKQKVSSTRFSLCHWQSPHHFSSPDQQWVRGSAQIIQRNLNLIMCHSMTTRQWVRQLYICARKSHQSYLIPWPTASEWHWFIALPHPMSHPMTNSKWVTLCFISLPGSLISHVSSPWHNQQMVSDAALFLCQAVSSIMSHSMTNS